MRDSQKSRVYKTESILQFFLDGSRDNPTCTIEGITLTLPPEAKFSSSEDVRRYVDRVIKMPSVIAEFGRTKEILVRPRKGQRVAHYEHFPPTIAVPENGTRWALREVVVLHELAHHFDRSSSGSHGPGFVGTMVTLLGLVMGPEIALLARILYAQNGVKAA